jgi:hypothetical protein
MDGKRIIDVMTNRIKAELQKMVAELQCELTPQNVTKIGEILVAAAASGVSHGIKEYVEQQDSREPSIVRNGRTLRKKTEKVDKKFLTVGGEVTISRTVYQSSSGGPCYVPLDHAMGVVEHYALPDVREAICYLCSLVTTREAEDVTQRLAMFHPSDKAIRNALADMGRWMERNEDHALTDIVADEPPLPEADVMVIGMDGANVLLRERGKKKGRPVERPTIDDSPDETKSCYKNAMTGTISFYATQRGVKDGVPTLEHKRLSGIYTSRMPEDRFPTFKSKFEREIRSAESRVSPDTVKIVLMDGARGLWKYVEESRLFEDYEFLLDFYHMSEHLSNLAEALFGKGRDDAKRWYRRWRDKIKYEPGGVEAMQRAVAYRLEKLKNRKAKLSKKRMESIVREQTFFANNKSKMEYKRFLDNGWPIGSGPTESGCKVLVKQRLCRSGMRWTRSGGQHVLSLRAVVKSNRWDALWHYYTKQLRTCAA